MRGLGGVTFLAIDIGNTNIVLGINENEKWQKILRLDTKKYLKANEWINYFKDFWTQNGLPQPGCIDAIILASVVPELISPILTVCHKSFKILQCHIITSESNFNLNIDVPQPHRIGIDRLLNAAAAYHEFQTDLIVIDLGTATTFDCVLKPKKFVGGIICPGIKTSAQALFHQASQLFPVEIEKTKNVIGKSTEDCLKSGLFYGYLGQIESLIDRIQNELHKNMTVIVTGGLAELFAKESIKIHHHIKYLTLDGMKLVYEWSQ